MITSRASLPRIRSLPSSIERPPPLGFADPSGADRVEAAVPGGRRRVRAARRRRRAGRGGVAVL
ncbi:hypothetical protein, partial [Micromonospora sp. I033]